MKRILLATAAIAVTGSLALISPAQAVPSISVAVSETSTPTTTIVNAATSGNIAQAFTTANYIGTITASGFPVLPQPTLSTNSINTQSTSAGTHTLFVWVTQQGLTSPVGIASFLSGFTSNLFTAGAVSVQEFTFIDTANGLYGGTSLANHLFNGIGTATSLNNTPSLSLFSETAEFIITTSAKSASTNDTITIQSAPEPMSIALVGAGLLGLGMVQRKRS
jgi:hypothetical protein